MFGFSLRVLAPDFTDRVAGVFRAPRFRTTMPELTGLIPRTDNVPEWQGDVAPDVPTRVRLPNGEMDVWHYPPSSQRNQTWFLLVHGFRGDHHGLSSFVDGLPEYDVVVPDLPGFGASPAMAREHTVANYAEILAQYLLSADLPVSLDVKNCVIVGHSFGSMVATKLSTLVPTKALILINPIAQLPLSAGNKLMTKFSAFYYRAGALLPRPLGYRLLRSPLIVRFMTEFMVVSDEKSMRAFAHEQHRKYFSAFASRQTLNEAYRASISSHCGVDAPDVHVPTLLIAGDQDPLATVEEQETLARLFPIAAKVVVLKDVGHLIHYEKPAQALAAIKGFVTGLTPGQS